MNHNVIITTLSPLVIKSGEELESHEYYLDEKEKKISIINFQSFLSNLPPLKIKEFESLCQAKRISVELRKFIKANWDKKSYTRQIPVSDSFIKEYVEQFNNDSAELNVKLHAYSAGKPIVPGSSLKGIIRTALGNQAYQHDKIDPVKYDIDKDPFRFLKVSDSANHPETMICKLEVFGSRQGFIPTGIKEFAEAIKPGTVSYHYILTTKEKQFNIPQIISALDEFSRLQIEHLTKYFQRNNSSLLKFTEDLNQRLKNYMQVKESGKRDAQTIIHFGFGSGSIGCSYLLKDPKLGKLPISIKTVEGNKILGWAKIQYTGPMKLEAK